MKLTANLEEFVDSDSYEDDGDYDYTDAATEVLDSRSTAGTSESIGIASSTEQPDTTQGVEAVGDDKIICEVPESSAVDCQSSLYSFWSLLGGLAMGIITSIVVMLCCSVRKQKKSYAEPYSFDNFVNP